MFQNVHPDRGSSWISSTAVNYGRNSENQNLRDDRYVRCRKCGFINHLDRSHRASVYSAAGTGIEIRGWGEVEWGGTWGGGDPVVTAGNGCSLCGTYLYL